LNSAAREVACAELIKNAGRGLLSIIAASIQQWLDNTPHKVLMNKIYGTQPPIDIDDESLPELEIY
jgi:hypothetical protein